MKSQSVEGVIYSPMNLFEHDSKTVARLIYTSSPPLFQLIFGSKVIEILSQLIERSHNRFSHRHIRVASLSEKVIGVLVQVPADQLQNEADYEELFSQSQRLRLKLANGLILRHLLRHHYPAKSLYVGNLAVDSAYQSCGIGSQLLAQCIAEAEQNYQDLFISVDIANGRAQKLYERLGFELVETKAIGLPGLAVGSRVLMRSPQAPQTTP